MKTLSIDDTGLLTLDEARELFPETARPTLQTLFRWCAEGCRGIKLKYLRAGKRMLTSKAAMNEFIEALGKKDEETLHSGIRMNRAPRRSARRERDIEHAKKTLVRAGIR